MTILRRVTALASTAFLLNGCIHSQATFSVLTGKRNAPQATTVFADADAFAKRRGFTLDNIEAMNGLKIAFYHRNANYLSVEHRTDSRTVNFDITANSDAYHQHVAAQLRRDFIGQYSSRYGEGVVSQR